MTHFSHTHTHTQTVTYSLPTHPHILSLQNLRLVGRTRGTRRKTLVRIEETLSRIALWVALSVLTEFATLTGSLTVLPGVSAVGRETVTLFTVKPTLLRETLELRSGERGKRVMCVSVCEHVCCMCVCVCVCVRVCECARVCECSYITLSIPAQINAVVMLTSCKERERERERSRNLLSKQVHYSYKHT